MGSKKKYDVLILLQLIFALLVILIGLYCRITENYSLLPLIILLLSVLVLIRGIREYKKTRNMLWVVFSVGISVVLISVIAGVF